MSNKIVQLKDNLGNLLYPKTKPWVNAGELNTAGTYITINKNFDTINNFHFRCLGNDSATFVYVTMPRLAWHNNGLYAFDIPMLNQAGTNIGYFQIVCQNKTTTLFEIKVVAKNGSKITIYYN